MVKRFEEVPVGAQFKVADCMYTKLEESTHEYHTKFSTCSFGRINATHKSAVGNTVYDYFIPTNMVEYDTIERQKVRHE